jgi:hypothetical protein
MAREVAISRIGFFFCAFVQLQTEIIGHLVLFSESQLRTLRVGLHLEHLVGICRTVNAIHELYANGLKTLNNC